MRTLIIGGTLFIGRAIALRLAAAGHEVTVLHRRGEHDLGPGIRNALADRSDLTALGRIIHEGGFDVVVDSAFDWENGTTPAQVEAAARSCRPGLHRYLFVSSMAAYGPGVDHNEQDPLVPDDFPDPYSRSKALSERALFAMHAERGFPVTTVRPPFVHGPRQPFYREQFFWDRMLDGRPIILPDGGDTPMTWVFVEDLADACVRMIDAEAAAGQAFNVAHAEPLTQRTFVETLGRVAGVMPTFVSLSREAIHAAGGRLLGGNLYFGEFLDLPPLGVRIEKARRVLGWAPTPLEVALRETFAAYRAQPRRPVDYRFEDHLLGV